MPITSPPITNVQAPGQVITVPNPLRPGAGNSWQVRIQNLTQFTLNITVAGRPATLQPFQSGDYPGLGSGEVIIVVGSAISVISTPQIYTTWAQDPDTLPAQSALAPPPVAAPVCQFGTVAAGGSLSIPGFLGRFQYVGITVGPFGAAVGTTDAHLDVLSGVILRAVWYGRIRSDFPSFFYDLTGVIRDGQAIMNNVAGTIDIQFCIYFASVAN